MATHAPSLLSLPWQNKNKVVRFFSLSLNMNRKLRRQSETTSLIFSALQLSLTGTWGAIV